MNDDILPQDLANYPQAQRDRINAIIEEERQKTRAWAATRTPDADAVLLGGSGFPGGLTAAVNPVDG